MKRRANSKGQSLVEAALTLTAFMGFVLGIANVGQVLFTRQALAQRVQDAARWGAMHPYDPSAIRNLVLYEATKPEPGEQPFVGLSDGSVEVTNPGCPGADCRVSVTVSGQGVRSVEPCEPVAGVSLPSSAGLSSAAPSRP